MPSDRGGVAAEISARTLKNDREIRRAVRNATQTKVADLMGVSAATVSRMHDDDINGAPSFIARSAALLAACGLKCVPEADETHSKERMAALVTLAREALSREGGASGFGDLS